jgi:tripartite-type tricarboxylate transporter receptor subunit TctC
MRKIERRTFIKNAAAAAVGGGVLGAPFMYAQEAGWPTKPIHFIVPLAPGGAIDFIARAVGEVMQRSANQQIVVETAPAPAAPSAWTRR